MKRIALFVSVALATVVLSAPVHASTDPATGIGNSVTRWVEHSLEAVRTQNVGTPNAGRLYAMVTAAMYDAVNGIDRARGHGRTPALVSPSGAPRNGHREVAAAAAAHAVLSAVLRADQPPVSDGALDRALEAEIAAAGELSDPPMAAGSAWGRHVGRQVVELRSADGTRAAQIIAACSRWDDPSACEPGEFHTSFDARWQNMAPFAITSTSPHVSAAPPALTSAEYARAFDDVRTCGSRSAVLDALCSDPTTPAQRTEISRFWLAEGGTVRETGTWLQAALAIVAQQGTVDSISDTSRLFALLGIAIADAVTVSWQAKATHFTWRPTSAIRQADTDGNPATTMDATWTSRIGSVGGSPEYTSGTSTFAGAASAVIEGFYCHETVGFSFQTDLASNGPRSYTSPLEAAQEAGRSRIFQGIHFQFSNDDGRRAGRGIGSEVVRNMLRPVSGSGQRGGCP